MRFVCLLSQRTPMLRGAPCWAFIAAPKVQGPLGPLFGWMLASACSDVLEWQEADYLVMIDAAIWPTLDAWQQERLMYHELRHVRARENEFGVPKLDSEGKPMLTLVPHDIELFADEIAYYGAETTGIHAHMPEIAQGLEVDRQAKGHAA